MRCADGLPRWYKTSAQGNVPAGGVVEYVQRQDFGGRARIEYGRSFPRIVHADCIECLNIGPDLR